MPSTHTCDGCLEQISATTKKELQGEGWQWHQAGLARWFVLCDECVKRYQPQWDKAKVPA